MAVSGTTHFILEKYTTIPSEQEDPPSGSGYTGGNTLVTTGIRTPFLPDRNQVTVPSTLSYLQIINKYIHIYLFHSEINLQWTVSTSKLFSRCPAFKSLPRGHLLLTKLQIFFTPYGKCRDTGIIRNYNVADSFHILSSSFFTNHRTFRCYTL
jgi:hypothetical protein